MPVKQAASGQNIQYEVDHILGAGKSLLVDFTLTPVFNVHKEVVYLVAEGKDISKRKLIELEEIMRYQAFHDHLTDLPNRALFNDRLSLALEQTRRNEKM